LKKIEIGIDNDNNGFVRQVTSLQ